MKTKDEEIKRVSAAYSAEVERINLAHSAEMDRMNTAHTLELLSKDMAFDAMVARLSTEADAAKRAARELVAAKDRAMLDEREAAGAALRAREAELDGQFQGQMALRMEEFKVLEEEYRLDMALCGAEVEELKARLANSGMDHHERETTAQLERVKADNAQLMAENARLRCSGAVDGEWRGVASSSPAAPLLIQPSSSLSQRTTTTRISRQHNHLRAAIDVSSHHNSADTKAREFMFVFTGRGQGIDLELYEQQDTRMMRVEFGAIRVGPLANSGHMYCVMKLRRNFGRRPCNLINVLDDYNRMARPGFSVTLLLENVGGRVPQPVIYLRGSSVSNPIWKQLDEDRARTPSTYTAWVYSGLRKKDNGAGRGAKTVRGGGEGGSISSSSLSSSRASLFPSSSLDNGPTQLRLETDDEEDDCEAGGAQQQWRSAVEEQGRLCCGLRVLIVVYSISHLPSWGCR